MSGSGFIWQPDLSDEEDGFCDEQADVIMPINNRRDLPWSPCLDTGQYAANTVSGSSFSPAAFSEVPHLHLRSGATRSDFGPERDPDQFPSLPSESMSAPTGFLASDMPENVPSHCHICGMTESNFRYRPTCDFCVPNWRDSMQQSQQQLHHASVEGSSSIGLPSWSFRQAQSADAQQDTFLQTGQQTLLQNSSQQVNPYYSANPSHPDHVGPPVRRYSQMNTDHFAAQAQLETAHVSPLQAVRIVESIQSVESNHGDYLRTADPSPFFRLNGTFSSPAQQSAEGRAPQIIQPLPPNVQRLVPVPQGPQKRNLKDPENYLLNRGLLGPCGKCRKAKKRCDRSIHEGEPRKPRARSSGA